MILEFHRSRKCFCKHPKRETIFRQGTKFEMSHILISGIWHSVLIFRESRIILHKQNKNRTEKLCSTGLIFYSPGVSPPNSYKSCNKYLFYCTWFPLQLKNHWNNILYAQSILTSSMLEPLQESTRGKMSHPTFYCSKAALLQNFRDTVSPY